MSLNAIPPQALTEIYKGSKQGHLRAILQKTGVPFERMCFFDDDPFNISDVRWWWPGLAWRESAAWIARQNNLTYSGWASTSYLLGPT